MARSATVKKANSVSEIIRKKMENKTAGIITPVYIYTYGATTFWNILYSSGHLHLKKDRAELAKMWKRATKKIKGAGTHLIYGARLQPLGA